MLVFKVRGSIQTLTLITLWCKKIWKCLFKAAGPCVSYLRVINTYTHIFHYWTQFWWGIGLKGVFITKHFVDNSHNSNYLTCMYVFEFCWALYLNKGTMTWLNYFRACWLDCNLRDQVHWLNLFSSHSTHVQNAAGNTGSCL